jgi:hypothetical protein
VNSFTLWVCHLLKISFLESDYYITYQPARCSLTSHLRLSTSFYGPFSHVLELVFMTNSKQQKKRYVMSKVKRHVSPAPQVIYSDTIKFPAHKFLYRPLLGLDCVTMAYHTELIICHSFICSGKNKIVQVSFRSY